jgi:thiamine-monophosphate kinase
VNEQEIIDWLSSTARLRPSKADHRFSWSASENDGRQKAIVCPTRTKSSERAKKQRTSSTGIPACVGLKLGIGDDAAIYQPKSTEDLVLTTDLFIEDVHFRRTDLAAAIGCRALARSLSDIAAMGASPRFCLVSLALAPWADKKWIMAFYRGLLRLAAQTKVSLAGGDLSHANQVLCDVMVCGAVPKDKALRRDGARPGDLIYVSGALGGWKHKRVIVPRLDIGKKVLGKATACMDISDGLALDLHRLALASGVAAELDFIPVLKGATVEQALHDGEDYELLYTAPASVRVPGILVGTIKKGKSGSLKYDGKPLPARGYDHFQQRS